MSCQWIRKLQISFFLMFFLFCLTPVAYSQSFATVTLLLPNSINQDNSIKSGKPHTFPPDGSKIHLQAQFLSDYDEPVAEERIKVIATKKKEDLIPLGFQEDIFKVYDAKSTGMISDLVKKLNQIEPIGWTEATAVYMLKK